MLCHIAVLVTILGWAAAQPPARARVKPKIPDILGYRTLLCDFHQHTVFSDGTVWPSVRVEEAWREGLDVLALTDHIEYSPWKDDVKRDVNRSYELIVSAAKDLGLLLVRGAEITKPVPPGHFNALFLADNTPADNADYLEACRSAVAHGAFLFWNHPPFGGNVVDDKPVWNDEVASVFDNGWLNGIEVANGRDYYPEAHLWAAEKKLTMLGTSDIHGPVNLQYDPVRGDWRSMTLVFAAEASQEAVREALKLRCTAVYCAGSLYGDRQYLNALFENSVEILNRSVTVKGRGRAVVQIRNKSDLKYELTSEAVNARLSAPRKVTLHPDATVILDLRGKDPARSGKEREALAYRVTNLQTMPDKGLPVALELEVTYTPEEPKTETRR
jgi:hypothetical protein